MPLNRSNNVDKLHLLKNTFRTVAEEVMAFDFKNCSTAKGQRFRYLNENQFRTYSFSVMTSSKFCFALCILEHVIAHMSILSQLLQKVDTGIDFRTAVDCVNNLQQLMKSCRDVSNNGTYDEIYQKAVDMVSPEEISLCHFL